MIMLYPEIILVDTVGTAQIYSSQPQWAQQLRVPKSGTITQVAIQLGSITTSQTMQATLQTISSTGLPTGTNYGGSTAGTFTPSGGNLNYVTLGTAATVTEGDEIAVVFGYSSTVGNLNLGTVDRTFLSTSGLIYPYAAYYNTAWNKSANQLAAYVVYSDGTIPDIGTIPAKSAGQQSFSENSGSSPDEYGNYFQMPMKAVVEGAWLYSGANSSPLDLVKLYAPDQTTVLAQANLSQGATGSASMRFYLFASTVILSQGLNYTLSYKSSSTSACSLGYETFGDYKAATASHGNIGGVQTIQGATRQNSGTWTLSTTNRYLLGLMIRQVLPAGSVGASYVY